MMDFTSGQYLQLIVGLALVLVAFIGAYLGPERAVVTVLILLLPFQPITSKFGTINTGLALLVFGLFVEWKDTTISSAGFRRYYNAHVFSVVYTSAAGDLPRPFLLSGRHGCQFCSLLYCL